MSKPKKWPTMTPEEQEAWRERTRQSNNNQRSKNPEKYRAKAKKYYADNTAKCLESNRLYRSTNADKIRVAKRKFYAVTENFKRKSEMDKVSRSSRRTANPDKYKEMDREKARKHYRNNKESVRNKSKADYCKNPAKFKERNNTQRVKIADCYIANNLKLPVSLIREHYPELLAAKREQIKILRELKPTNKKQTQCTRIQSTCNKSETTLLKLHTPHGSINLSSLELSSWSTPWVRQLIPLLSKSKRQR